MKKIILMAFWAILIIACAPTPNNTSDSSKADTKATKAIVDEGKGVGEITNVKLNDPLDKEMIQRGEAIYEMKCAACHKLSGARVVGPSWEGVTDRRKPEWIMNMVTNVEVMLEKDPEARKLLEECLTRMPNQNVSIVDARDILEFMYSLDAPK